MSIFFDSSENDIIQNFLELGYVIFPLSDKPLLDSLQCQVAALAQTYLNAAEQDPESFLDNIHKQVDVKNLNGLRLSVIQSLSSDQSVRTRVYRIAQQYIHTIVGNELAMQRACNLSIQMPEDDSSLLPLHADTWSGNSPYEIVLWIPFVNCSRSKSMFILPRNKSDAIYRDFSKYASLSTNDLFNELKPDLTWLEVPYGHAIIFSHSLIHGNIINKEPTTRWSINVRFKSILSPYGTKDLGESFSPITIRPATRIGYAYQDIEL